MDEVLVSPQGICSEEIKFTGDDDEDNDSDWVPLRRRIPAVKWFCTNCTIVNFDDTEHCEICGEHKKSSILNHGFFACPSTEGACSWDYMPHLLRRCRGQNLISSALQKATAVGFDERMLLHSEAELKSHPHPERPDRLRTILASFAKADFFREKCFLRSAREITVEELSMVHTAEYIDSVELTSQTFSSYFTPDTYANEHSALAARLAAGICADLSQAIVSGQVKNGFALVRPPGHHAGVRKAMGFCLHNNAAIAAHIALASGAKKILILDWDVHHGNGTQEIFEKSKSVLYVSLHRHDDGRFYPGTGAVNEVGSMDGTGFSVNIPWNKRGAGDNNYIFAFRHVVLPIAREFAPDLTIVSAGFDAARGDPLGGCNVTPAGFAWMTQVLDDVSRGKILVILEGGYNLRSISASATAVLKVLLGEYPNLDLPQTQRLLPSRSGLRTVIDVLNVHAQFWPVLRPGIPQLRHLSLRLEAVSARASLAGKRRNVAVPFSWRWGRRRLLFSQMKRAKNK